MANDITGGNIRCPKCKITHLTPEIVNGRLYLYCPCGYGKEEYFKAKKKKKKIILKLMDALF